MSFSAPSNSEREARKQLSRYSCLDDFFSSLQSCSNIVIISGAGISVPCGIPDFRSKGGIYHTIDCQEIGLPTAELLFDLRFFEMEPEPFYKYAKNLLPSQSTLPSLSHHLISYLESQNKLLRNYTQNFDGLEAVAGVTRFLQSHGTIQKFKCLKCRKKVELDEAIREEIEKGEVPYCDCGGVMKPSIIFFGELLDNNLLKQLQLDCEVCDLIIVMGTSLSVGGPVISFLNQVSPKVPQVLMNLRAVEPPKAISNGFDLSLIGECDVIVSYISNYLQWDLMNVSPTPAPEVIDTKLPEPILDPTSLLSSQSTVSPLSYTNTETESTSLLILEAGLSSKRRRRLPSHLMHDYGVYRDDQTDPVFMSELPNAHSSLYHSSSIAAAATKPVRKRKSLPNPLTPAAPIAAATTVPSPDESFAHLPRELRELYKTSNGFLDLTLDRRQRRENIRNRKSLDTATAVATNTQLCPQQLAGVRWEAVKRRVYKFQRENLCPTLVAEIEVHPSSEESSSSTREDSEMTRAGTEVKLS